MTFSNGVIIKQSNPRKMGSTENAFRKTFQISKELMNWYPKHMRNSLIHMQAKLRLVDCIVEVHDARIPFTGRNPIFMRNLLGSKPHILVLTKVDLIDPSSCKDIILRLKEEDQHNVIFVNCLKPNSSELKKIVPTAVKLMKNTSEMPKVDHMYRMMILGVPNVGKSSLINALRYSHLRRGKATPVGAHPGITTKIQNEIKVNENPPLYLIDTPGLLFPSVSDVEHGMKLALCSCLRDDLVGIKIIADFLLYWMNKTNNFRYVDVFNLGNPTDDILKILVKIANEYNKTTKFKNLVNNTYNIVPDIYFGATHMVSLFRKGTFGDLNLDGSYINQ